MLVLGQEEGWRGIGSEPRKECDKEGAKDLLPMPFSQRKGACLYIYVIEWKNQNLKAGEDDEIEAIWVIPSSIG